MNAIDLKNKTAVITGGAQGFGLAITERFLDSGANVIIWDIDVTVTNKTIQNLDNPRLSALKVNVANFDEVEKAHTDNYRKK